MYVVVHVFRVKSREQAAAPRKVALPSDGVMVSMIASNN